ncbi:GAF domain-containing protein [Winogradskyella sp. D23]|uniref:GAF domain-containing protein n=2 Tax=Winogradskyella alexanderae TaxID=2877123 RepID=A0ABS7XSV3_9FLAO|nr:GAF domain-containing protein [Winogradskyella alexanderae]
MQYNSESGAPFDKVATVLQDREGFVWIGSQNGLYRFDGSNFDIYSIHTESQSIHQLHSNKNSIVFVNDKGLYQIETIVGEPKFSKILEGTINETEESPFYPNDFIFSKDESIWISQSNHSIGKWHDNSFETYCFTDSENAQNIVLQEDSQGGIWALSPLDGLYLYNPSTNKFDKKLDIKNGQALIEHNNQLLVGNENLHIFSITSNSLKEIKTLVLQDDLITALNIDHNNQYYVGTEKGNLFKLKDLNSSPQTIYGANEAHRVEKLDFGPINEIYITTDNISNKDQLWVSSDTGLWLLEQRFFKTVDNLPMNNPIGISISKEGKAWVPINYIFEIFSTETGFDSKIIHKDVQANAVAIDVQGALWVTTTTPRVELLKFENDKIVKRYDFHDRGESIFYLYPDSEGNVWFNQAPIDKPIIGIAKIDTNGNVKFYDETKGFSSRVLALKESSRGEVYAVGIGEKSYLYKFDAVQDRFINLSPKLPFNAILNFEVHDLTIDDRGIVWLASTDGLLRYDGEKITLVQNDILGQEEVRGVTHYSNNNIWVATATKGLVFHKENTSTHLGESEGLPAVISAYRCIATDNEGRLWVGTAEGLVYSRISASTLPNSHTPRIRKVFVDRTEETIDFNSVFEVDQRKPFELQFTNLSFPSKNVQYQYRLLPKEDRDILLVEQLWESNANGNSIKLDDIELGDYSLEVRARQPGGYQWSEPLEIELYVFTPWYSKMWFIYGLVLLGIVLVGFYFRVYVRRRFKRFQDILKYSNEKLAKKEEQLNEKIKELEEKGDQLVSATSNIHTLELFIKEIPKKASWNDIITAMGKAVAESVDVNAFEIAFKENEEIVHKGYSNQERSGYTFRAKPFNAKTSLTCWAMENNQEVLINDFEKEHTMYIQEKDVYRFRSLLFIPFSLDNDQPVVLCAYSTKQNHFDSNDLIMFRILAQFIHFSIHDELTKQL